MGAKFCERRDFGQNLEEGLSQDAIVDNLLGTSRESDEESRKLQAELRPAIDGRI